MTALQCCSGCVEINNLFSNRQYTNRNCWNRLGTNANKTTPQAALLCHDCNSKGTSLSSSWQSRQRPSCSTQRATKRKTHVTNKIFVICAVCSHHSRRQLRHVQRDKIGLDEQLLERLARRTAAERHFRHNVVKHDAHAHRLGEHRHL